MLVNLIVIGGGSEEPHEDGVDNDEKPPPSFSKIMHLVSKRFYGRGVDTRLVYRSDRDWSAYVVECRTTVWEVEGSSPQPDQHSGC